jgi:hypothetical protein
MLRITREEILEALAIEIIELGENIRDIIRINQMGNQFKWYVQFKDETWFKSLFGKTIRIRDQDIEIEDANDDSLIRTFRVLHAPQEMSENTVIANFKKYGELIECVEEEIRSGKFEGMKTGIFRVKMKFTKDKANSIGDVHGVRFFKGQRFIVQMVGHQACFLCKNPGHQKAECPQINLKCVKCKGRGHDYKDCSDAKRLLSANFDEELLDLDDNDNETDSAPTIAPIPTVNQIITKTAYQTPAQLKIQASTITNEQKIQDSKKRPNTVLARTSPSPVKKDGKFDTFGQRNESSIGEDDDDDDDDTNSVDMNDLSLNKT